MSFVGVVAAIGAVGAILAKVVFLVAPWMRRRSKEAERQRKIDSAEDILTMEFGHDTTLESPDFETVMRAIDRLGMPERPKTLALVNPREDYVQAEFLGDGRYAVEARRHEGRKAMQLRAETDADDTVSIDDVRQVFAEFHGARRLSAAFKWRDITKRH